MCGSIAWQQSEKVRLNSIRENKRKEGDVECIPATASVKIKEPFKTCGIPYDAAAAMEDFEPDKARFVNRKHVISNVVRRKGPSLKKRYGLDANPHSTAPNEDAATALHSAAGIAAPTAPNEDAATDLHSAAGIAAAAGIENVEYLSRIYICSRTHTQLSQLINGFKDTVYTPSMAVLGSRDQMCIHPIVALSATKNEDCIKMIGVRNVNGCRFLQGTNSLANHSSMRGVWDIEDIVSKGRQFRACPYFAAQDIAEKADVVFCPYNYLLDKCSRESAGINLKNNIVIFDEAHNLEDQCREAASFVVTITLLNDVMTMFDACQHFPNCPSDVTLLCFAITAIRCWIHDREQSMSFDGNGRDKIMEFVGDQVLHQLSEMGLTNDNVRGLSSVAGKLQKWHNEVVENSEMPNAFKWVCPGDGKTHSVVPAFSVSMRKWQMIILVSGYAHDFGNDYAICMQRLSSNSETSVNILCLNPGVAFRDLREQCRSLVLTSGALRDCRIHIDKSKRHFVHSSYGQSRHSITNGFFLLRARLRFFYSARSAPRH